MKKMTIVLVLCVVCLAGLIGISNIDSTVQEETAIISNNKIVGSDDYMFTKEEIDDIGILLEHADLIVSGYALDEGRTVKELVSMNKEVVDKFENQFGKKPTKSMTEVEFVVTETLYGEEITGNIIISQHGEAGVDRGETKLKPKAEVLLILRDNVDGTFSIVGLENGAFTIHKDGTIISHSNDQAVAKYDSKKMSDLLEDIDGDSKMKIEKTMK